MGISSMRGVWAVLLCVVWVSPGAAASDVDPAALPAELRAEICETAKRAATLWERMLREEFVQVEPELRALVEESEAYLAREQIAAKYFAIHLRRALSLLSINYPLLRQMLELGMSDLGAEMGGEMEEEGFDFAFTVPPLNDVGVVHAFRDRCRVSEADWLRACVIPGTTMAEWVAANRIESFLRDPSLVAPLPPHAWETLKKPIWIRLEVRGENPEFETETIRMGASGLFGEACHLIQTLRDAEVLYESILKELDENYASLDDLGERRESLSREAVGLLRNRRRLDYPDPRLRAGDDLRSIEDRLSATLGASEARFNVLLPSPFLPPWYVDFVDDPVFLTGRVVWPGMRADIPPPHGFFLRESAYVLDEERYPEAPSPDWSGFEFGQTAVIMLPGEIPLEMVLAPAGSFLMGSRLGFGQSNEYPARVVTIDHEFYIAKYETTQEQWTALMGTNPSDPKRGVGPKHPVQNIPWDDVQDFLAALNRLGAGHFRLPSEAEWEYACRAGSTTRYCFGDDRTMLGDYAWHSGNSDVDGTGQKAQPVGQKLPNMFGLYDMHGNVAELCADVYFDRYSIFQTDGSARSTFSGREDSMEDICTATRVARGGTFVGDPASARRSGGGTASSIIGLRVVRER